MLWLFLYITEPFFKNFDDNHKILIAPVLISMIYIIGMIIDSLGKMYTDRLERMIAKHFKSLSVRKFKIECSLAEIIAFNSELGKQLEMRSSRDRIARGAIINTLISIIIFSFKYPENRVIVFALGLTIFVSLTLLWMRYQRLSNKYLNDCQVALLKEKSH